MKNLQKLFQIVDLLGILQRKIFLRLKLRRWDLQINILTKKLVYVDPPVDPRRPICSVYVDLPVGLRRPSNPSQKSGAGQVQVSAGAGDLHLLFFQLTI